MVKFCLCLLSVLTLTLQVVFAQQDSRETVNQSIQWVAVNSNLTLGKRLTLQLDGQFRQAGQLDPQQYQARTALEIKLNDHFSIAPAGYVYTWNYLYGKQPAAFKNNEHRLWQQVIFKHHVGIVHLEHRLRSEERFIQRQRGANNGEIIDEGYSDFQFRLRYRFSAKVPLGNSKIEPHTYFASLYDEVFMSRGKYVTYEKPDQNRVFAGFGYQFDKSLTIQGGFIYQLLVKSGGTKQENNCGILLQLVYNMDLTRHR